MIDERISIHAPRAGRDVILFCDPLKFPQFQSTRPVRGATHPDTLGYRAANISIHAPRAGRDGLRKVKGTASEFQSTRPVRGATGVDTSTAQRRANFNPRAPCGARLAAIS